MTRRVQMKLRANAKQRIVTLRFPNKTLRQIKTALHSKKVLKASIRLTAAAKGHRAGSRRVAITVKR